MTILFIIVRIIRRRNIRKSNITSVDFEVNTIEIESEGISSAQDSNFQEESKTAENNCTSITVLELSKTEAEYKKNDTGITTDTLVNELDNKNDREDREVETKIINEDDFVTRNQKYSENGNRGTAKSGTRIQ